MERPLSRPRLGPLSVGSSLVALALFGSSAPLLAEEQPPAQPAARNRTFDSVSHGGVVSAGIGTSSAGVALLGELGATSLGIKTVGDGSWLLQWDAFLGGMGGVLANAHPYLDLLGARADGYLEGGYRLHPTEAWSPYAGARGSLDVQVLDPLGTAFSNLKSLNTLDGVAGVNVNGAVRVEVGASYLGGPHSLLLVAFVQEALRAPAVNTPGAAFTEGGIGARFDIARSLFVSIEGLGGRAPATTDAALHLADQKAHLEVSASFRKIFANGMWLGAAISLADERDHLTYESSATSYDTANAPTFGFSLSYGLPFGRQE